RGQIRKFAATFTDPGILDTHTTAWSVRDGSGTVVATGTGTTFAFTPTNAGAYSVEFTVIDNAGGTARQALTLNVRVFEVRAPDPGSPTATILAVGGNTRAENIE